MRLGRRATLTTQPSARSRMPEIAERDDPAYTLLHQNAAFTAKRRDIKWRAAPCFAMDFRAGNFGL